MGKRMNTLTGFLIAVCVTLLSVGATAEAEFQDYSIAAGVSKILSGYLQCSYRLRSGQNAVLKDSSGTTLHRFWSVDYFPFEGYHYQHQHRTTEQQQAITVDFQFALPESLRRQLIPYIPTDGIVELPNGRLVSGNGTRDQYQSAIEDPSNSCSLSLQKNFSSTDIPLPRITCRVRDRDFVNIETYYLRNSFNEGNGTFGYIVLQENCN